MLSAAHELRFALRSLQVEEAQRKAAEAAAEQQGLTRGSAPVRRKQVGHAPVRHKQAGRGVAGSGFAWLLPFCEKGYGVIRSFECATPSSCVQGLIIVDD